MNESAVKYRNAPYSFLEDFAGVYTAFQMPIHNDVFKATWYDGSELKMSQTFDGYELRGAESLATYTNDHPEGLSVITCKKAGKGRVILLGTMISGEDMVRLVEKECGFAPIATASKNIELVQRGDLILALEMENERGMVVLNGKYEDVLTGNIHEGETEILPYSVMVFKSFRGENNE